MPVKKSGFLSCVVNFFKSSRPSDSKVIGDPFAGVSKVAHVFHGLPLWTYFTEKSGASAKQIGLVQDGIDYALPLLDRYLATFPTYTLHNTRHQQNIVRLMGELLGSDLEKLTALECAMLILSAVFHDLGMVFTSEELASIEKEEDFKVFLEQNPNANLTYEQNNRKLDDGLTEWYCRWVHAKRVWVYLNRLENDNRLKWGTHSIRKQLGDICESHNESTQSMLASGNLEINFLSNCDLLFCSILLRLADILDFDNTRSPQSVYDFLGLGKPKNASERVSRDEWNKHLSSSGFIFYRAGSEIDLRFEAEPEHPAIEQNMRKFITVIDSELKACQETLRHCNKRWVSFQLPEKVNTKNIISKNYESGNFRFSLSEDKIIKLLTGDEIYEDDFIFIREILQNAIDTVRYKSVKDKAAGLLGTFEPIQVTSFHDKEGHLWIRVDDKGVGMDYEIIRDNLLKKGESYYRSNKFLLEQLKLKKKTNEEFYPISRFGIGLLSCFIAGDKIEINTRYYNEGAGEQECHRLSVEGSSGLFVLRSKAKKHLPTLMPSATEDDEGYRADPGTSVAVRISTNKDYQGFKVKDKLQEFILSSPVPIMYKNEAIGGDFKEMVEEPWATNTSIPASREFVLAMEELLEISLSSGIMLRIESINISANSRNPNLKGQFVFTSLDIPDVIGKTVPFDIRISLEPNKGEVTIHCRKAWKDGHKDQHREIFSEPLSVNPYLKIPESLKSHFNRYPENTPFGKLLLSHNGIFIPDEQKLAFESVDLVQYFKHKSAGYKAYLYTGILYFQDSLLPELTIARNQIKRLSFDIISQISFSLNAINKYLTEDVWLYTFFPRIEYRSFYVYKNIEESKLYELHKDYWDNLQFIYTDTGALNLKEASGVITSCKVLRFVLRNYRSNFYTEFLEYLVESHFTVTLTVTLAGKKLDRAEKYLKAKTGIRKDAILDFKPFSFMGFNTNIHLIACGEHLNIDHPWIQWYLKEHAMLRKEHFYNANQFIYFIIAREYGVLERVTLLNNLIERLRTILPKDAQPHTLPDFSEKDFIDRGF